MRTPEEIEKALYHAKEVAAAVPHSVQAAHGKQMATIIRDVLLWVKGEEGLMADWVRACGLIDQGRNN